ncbi:hypothetical protein LCGC14_1353460 [marine sediment metagenome]|uniref:DNA-binding protein n=1 Tax=marine sediment metagenome TaxID=412755 RepID=A0A0F9KAT3_9ZZZZ
MAWLKSEAKAGRIPCLKVNRQLFFNLKTVEEALIDRSCQEADRRLLVNLKAVEQTLTDRIREAGNKDEPPKT